MECNAACVLAEAPHVGAVPEVDVVTAQCGQFEDPQSGLDRDEQQRVIPPPEPPAGVRRGEQRVDFLVGAEGHDSTVAALGWEG